MRSRVIRRTLLGLGAAVAVSTLAAPAAGAAAQPASRVVDPCPSTVQLVVLEDGTVQYVVVEDPECGGGHENLTFGIRW